MCYVWPNGLNPWRRPIGDVNNETPIVQSLQILVRVLSVSYGQHWEGEGACGGWQWGGKDLSDLAFGTGNFSSFSWVDSRLLCRGEAAPVHGGNPAAERVFLSSCGMLGAATARGTPGMCFSTQCMGLYLYMTWLTGRAVWTWGGGWQRWQELNQVHKSLALLKLGVLGREEISLVQI